MTELESRVDKFEDQLGSYLMQLGARDMKEEDNSILTVVLHCINPSSTVHFPFLSLLICRFRISLFSSSITSSSGST